MSNSSVKEPAFSFMANSAKLVSVVTSTTPPLGGVLVPGPMSVLLTAQGLGFVTIL